MSKNEKLMNLERLQDALRKNLLNKSCLLIPEKIEVYGILKDLDYQMKLYSTQFMNSNDILSKYQTQQQELWKLFLEFNERDSLPRNEQNDLTDEQQEWQAEEVHRNQSLSPRKNEEKRKKVIPKQHQQQSLSSSAASHNQDMTSASTITTLLMKQKDISIKELEEEKMTQQNVIHELTELTAILKENTIAMSETVQDQNRKLDVMQRFAEENVVELDDQKKNLTKQQKSQKINFWTTVWIIITILLTFAGTYVVIRLFPKP